MSEKASSSAHEHLCATPGCGKPARMACPTCLKLGIPPSRFCSQDCFKGYWGEHKKLHSEAKKSREAHTEERALPKAAERASHPLLQPIDDRLKTWRPLEIFFGSQLVSEREKWLREGELTQQLQRDPDNVELLSVRAILRLQCGIPFHAYSDCERIQQCLRRATEHSTRVFKLALTASLLTLLSFLAMRLDHEQIANELIFYFEVFSASPQHKEFSAKIVSIVLRSASMVSMTEARLQLLSTFGASLSMDTDSLHGKILLLLHALFQSIDASFNEKLEQIESNPQCQRMSIEERKFTLSAVSVSPCTVPMQYRSGPGGERSPEFVTRTLSSLREEVMQNVEIVSDPERGGFKMVAKRDIRKDTIFLTEEHTVCLSSKFAPGNECAFCTKSLLSRPAGKAASSSDRLACNGCGERYCSTECKEKAWQQYHSLLCNSGWNAFLEAINLPNCKSSLPYAVCTSLKLILMGVSRGVNPLQWPELQVLHRITDSPTPIDPAKVPTVPITFVDKIIRMYDAFRTNCKTLARHIYLEDLLELVNVVGRNGMGAVGFGCLTLYCAASFANHDCSPNTDYKGRPPMLTFRATKKIAKGEEITISYVDTDQDKAVREMKLELFYGFQCGCLRCKMERMQVT